MGQGEGDRSPAASQVEDTLLAPGLVKSENLLDAVALERAVEVDEVGGPLVILGLIIVRLIDPAFRAIPAHASLSSAMAARIVAIVSSSTGSRSALESWRPKWRGWPKRTVTGGRWMKGRSQWKRSQRGQAS